MESEETNANIFDNELDFEEEVKEDIDVFEALGLDEMSAADTLCDIEALAEDLEPVLNNLGLANGSSSPKPDEAGEEAGESENEGDNNTPDKKEESDSEGEISDSDEKEDDVKKPSAEMKNGEDREEGECSDGDEVIIPPPPIHRPRVPCKFFNRGFCNWGMNCKFLHAGFNDKGNYRMFEPMKHPMSVMNCEPNHPMRRPPPPMAAPVRPPPAAAAAAAKQESAWERGLRQAKEMMRQAQQRKETDIDFEEKKMNLSLGEDDIYKENVLNTRPASPLFSRSDHEDEENFPDRMNFNYPMQRPPMQRRMPFQGPRHFNNGRGGGGGGGGGPYYRNDQNFNKNFNRNQDGGRNWDQNRRRNDAPRGGRGDEWSDPWMRKRSPTTTRRSRRSHTSSYSSSSRSRSRSYSSSSRSSRSSYSSYSSRSRSRSKSRSQSRSKLSPIARKEELYGKQMMNRQPAKTKSQQPQPSKPTVSPAPAKAESPKVEPKPVALDYNPMYQNPPAPEAVDKPVAEVREEKKLTISPFGIQQSLVRTLPGNMLKKAKKKAAKKNKKSSKKKAKSDTDSDSSSSSSSTSSSSSSSSSDTEEEEERKSKLKKKIVIDGREALANIVKISAMDALRMSGQKQQIKLKLKPSDSAKFNPELVPASVIDSVTEDIPVPSRKRSIDSVESDASKAKKAANTRREELLTQLKAIEDAIKRKRSKLQ